MKPVKLSRQYRVVIAIIPAAGKGTRMRSVTGGGPKELLKLGSRTVLQRITEEARDAEPDGIIVVNSPHKLAIDEWVHTQNGIQIRVQAEPCGLADAVASAEVIDDAVIFLGDAVYLGGSPVKRMANLLHRGISGCIAVEEVSQAQMHLYGIVEINEMNGSIVRILEKPSPSDTASRWAVAARYALSVTLMADLADFCLDPVRRALPGELSFTEFLNLSIQAGADIRAVPLQPGQRRVDCGSPEEYALAQKEKWD